MSSSKTGVVFSLIILVALIGGIYVYSSHKKSASPAAQTTAQTAQQTLTPTPTPALPPGNSDAQLQQDTTQIDNSIKIFNTDTTAVDQGLNDQPGNLQ